MTLFSACFKPKANKKEHLCLVDQQQAQAVSEQKAPEDNPAQEALVLSTVEVQVENKCRSEPTDIKIVAEKNPANESNSQDQSDNHVAKKSAKKIDSQRSLRPKKTHRTSKHRTLHTMKKTANRTLTLEAAAKIPKGENSNDWHAVNTLDFYNDLSLLMGILDGELCTAATCPCMSAGPNFKYLWADKGAKPKSVCASAYIEKMMVWVESQLDDPKIFALRSNGYPQDFVKHVRNIHRKLFRAYAHAYHSHFDIFVSLGAESHLNTCFKHFIIYGQTHKLLDDKDTAPLKEFIPSLLQKGGGKNLLQNSLA